MARKRKRRNSGARRGRAATAPKQAPARSGAPERAKPLLDNGLLGLAGLGVLLTGYLTMVAWFGEQPAWCGAGSGCDIVQSSRWSTLLGLPMAFWGLLTYALLAGLAWRLRSRPLAWGPMLFFACIGVGVSWFLTLVSIFEIDAVCEFCLASFALMNLLLLLTVLRRPERSAEREWRRALLHPVSATLVLVLGLHLHFSGFFDPAAGPEDPYLKALAAHLKRRAFLRRPLVPGLPGAEGALHCLRQTAALYRMRPLGAERAPHGRLHGPGHPALPDMDRRGPPPYRRGGCRTAGPGVEIQLGRGGAGKDTGGIIPRCIKKHSCSAAAPCLPSRLREGPGEGLSA